MTWWNALTDWLTSTEGQRIITNVVLPFVAIIVAGVLAALIARSMGKRLLEARDRETKANTVTALIASARRSIEWSTLGADERAHTAHLSDEASIRLRLLPVAGADLAAVWSEHEIASIRSNSATFRFQAEQTFADLRDRLVQWQTKPTRAKKLFRDEVERWNAEKAEDKASQPESATTQSFVPVDGESSPVQAPTAFAPAPVVPATPPAAATQDAAIAAMEQTPAEPRVAAAAPSETATDEASPVETAPREASPVEGSPVEAERVEAAGAEAGLSSEAHVQGGVEVSDVGADPSISGGAPTRAATGMVTTPVVNAPVQVSAESAGAESANAESANTERGLEPADSESRDDESGDDREPAFSAPVSAHQVRRRTTPDES
ncbi:hypothetical protein [Frondihabitans sp. VKM Ac-2883]|uniref:hypothetical protein n=1 Tax=Frondihabitans sp. VKM Ac-2883 TaxID=2783823 RepID=UPI00188A8388|nr:hypothetical protein [Frondihabitans sp. VKM Ac-2883]MBF4576676.1 hypothetical protein [Frondihabitans sp. VKM Ac-2883]